MTNIPELESKGVTQTYNKIATSFSNTRTKPWDWIQKFLKSLPNESSVLDIGCGSGHGSSTLATKFKEVHAVDISTEAIDYAKEHWQLPNIHFQTGDSLAMSFKENSFDVVVAFEVFEHLTDWRTFLSLFEFITS